LVSLKRLSRHFIIQDLVSITTWVIVFGIVLIMLQHADDEIQQNRHLIISCFIGYLICYFMATRNFSGALPLNWQKLAFALQITFAFSLMLLIPADFLPILTIVWVCVSLRFMRPNVAFIVTTIMVVLWFSLVGYVWEEKHVIYTGLLYYVFHLFALMTSVQTLKAERASEQAKQLNTELIATRELLAESSKVQERTRIARELHDLLGHHLTALNINLQVAEHLATQHSENEELAQSISQSYFLAKLLLSDVREAVSTIRANHAIDISTALTRLDAAFPNLSIHLDIQPLPWDNIEFAHDVLRCVQEAATNAVKHGDAQNVYVRITTGEQGVKIMIHDDGEVSGNITAGHGMTGMSERIARYGGNIAFDVRGASMAIHVFVPQHAVIGADANDR